jgi:hypothetical protein
MENRKFNLKQYSSFAGVLLIMHNNTKAQAVYTDIDPDVVLTVDGNYTFIDMDGNGTNEFFMLKDSHYFTNSEYSWYRFNKVLWAGPQFTPENEIAGHIATHGAGGATTYFPYALLEGDIINNSLSFQYGSYQLMGIGFYKVDEIPWTWNYYNGYWQYRIDSAYLGVRFLGADDCKHYGWIRCSVGDSLKTLTIHDFAYESKCNTPIIAGDTIGDTTTIGIGELNNLEGTIYTFNQHVYIILNEQKEINVFVYNINGQTILNTVLSQKNIVIDMSGHPFGTYIIKLTSRDKQFSEIIEI